MASSGVAELARGARRGHRGELVEEVERRLRGQGRLSDPTRVRIFDALSHGPKTVAELAAHLDVPADRLYYHLDRLEEGGVVRLAAIRPKRVYELAISRQVGAELDEPTAGVASAVLEAARIEAEAVLDRDDGKRQVVLTYTTVDVPDGDLNRLRSALTAALEATHTDDTSTTEAAATKAKSKKRTSRRARVVLAAYLLDD